MPATLCSAKFRRPERRLASTISKASRRQNGRNCWTRVLGLPRWAKVALIGSGYEHFFGMDGGWDYITEENAEASVGMLPQLLRRVVALRNDVAWLA